MVSQNYEEIVFNEPVDQFYDLLTGGIPPSMGPKGKGGKGKQALQQRNARTAEIPLHDSPSNPYSRTTENKELDRLGEANRTVEQMIKEERARLVEKEKTLAALRESEGVPASTRKR